MDFNSQIINIGKEIYQTVIKFVEANKGDDDKLYKGAILKLSDDRKMFFSFNPRVEADIKIWNVNWNDEMKASEGDSFYILFESGYGFLVNVHFYNFNKLYLNYTASEEVYPVSFNLTANQKNDIKNYMLQLQEQVSMLEYDKVATCSIDNFTYEARRQYNIDRYNNEMGKLNGIESTSKILPAVETAVDWWVAKLTGKKVHCDIGDDVYERYIALEMMLRASRISIDENKVILIKRLLSEAIMNRLSHGVDVRLNVDYGPEGILQSVISESGINASNVPLKTDMIVGVDSVKVSLGYGAEFEEIFNTSVEKGTKIRVRK